MLPCAARTRSTWGNSVVWLNGHVPTVDQSVSSSRSMPPMRTTTDGMSLAHRELRPCANISRGLKRRSTYSRARRQLRARSTNSAPASSRSFQLRSSRWRGDRPASAAGSEPSGAAAVLGAARRLSPMLLPARSSLVRSDAGSIRVRTKLAPPVNLLPERSIVCSAGKHAAGAVARTGSTRRG